MMNPMLLYFPKARRTTFFSQICYNGFHSGHNNYMPYDLIAKNNNFHQQSSLKIKLSPFNLFYN